MKTNTQVKFRKAHNWRGQTTPGRAASVVRVLTDEVKALISARLEAEGQLVLKPVPVLRLNRR